MLRISYYIRGIINTIDNIEVKHLAKTQVVPEKQQPDVMSLNDINNPRSLGEHANATADNLLSFPIQSLSKSLGEFKTGINSPITLFSFRFYKYSLA